MPAEGTIKFIQLTTLRQGGFFIITMSRIIIFANGLLTQPERLRRRLFPGDRIFCADGGTVHALALGLTPEIIIGDLDSLPPDVVEMLAAKGVTIQRHPVRKDHTDLELAFQVALAEQPSEIILTTALGGRLDQMLANILLLTRPEYASVKVSLVDESQWATIIRTGQTLTINGRPGDTLSLLPLTPTISQVTFTGVEWPLHAATLTLGSTYSISNTLIDSQAHLTIGEGMLLVIHLEQSDE